MRFFQKLRGEMETLRLRIRRWEHKDFEAYVHIVSDPAVMTPAGCEPAGNLESAAGMFRKDLRNDLCYAIQRKDTGEVIGRIKYQTDLRRFHVNSLSVGYELRRDQWGQGYMPEALAAMVAYGFEKRGLDVLAVSHYADNARSQRVIEKCGFRLEGVTPWACRRFDGKICDDVCYSILKQDYFEGLSGRE
ncbi:N-acetyltransferase [Acutalibacter sp. 1XD8-33]|uniref:GNAT family N-acetyltransferase n=1 Tax=Acutalibacter sp. 1XD8-33 TaxID=2320081 RepID=UPI000EA0377F|nr:GNAT family N-acetyltransferase [Acutalibacter sp. 1XD8-33]RKJ40757.1 N-acetyltransferase [Acutalibacter sp. 1XD8-33]